MRKCTNVGIIAKVTAQYFFYKVYFMYILCIVTGIMLKRCLCVMPLTDTGTDVDKKTRTPSCNIQPSLLMQECDFAVDADSNGL